MSLGGEVLLAAAARDHRLAAVVSDGGARVADSEKVANTAPVDRAVTWLAVQSSRAISGMEPSRPLAGMLPDIAPRPVLLVAAGAVPVEGEVARLYQRAGGDSVEVWEAPGAGHTADCASIPLSTRGGRSASSTRR